MPYSPFVRPGPECRPTDATGCVSTFSILTEDEILMMRFVSKQTLVFMFASALSVCLLGSDAFAQSGSRGGGYAAPAASASSAPVYSSPQIATPQSAAVQFSSPQYSTPSTSLPMAVGAGCVNGNCGGAVNVQSAPVISYSSPVAMQSVPMASSSYVTYSSPAPQVYSSNRTVASPVYSCPNSTVHHATRHYSPVRRSVVRCRRW